MRAGRRIIFIISLASLSLFGLSIITESRVTASPQKIDEKISSTQWDWVTEQWIGNEKTYRSIRFSIDQQIEQGQEPIELANQYRVQAEDWRDPVMQYRWAYPMYLAEKRQGFSQTSRNIYNAKVALSVARRENPPRNYEYARLEFLLGTCDVPSSNLALLGQRLVERNPKDFDVRYYWAGCMAMSPKYTRSKMRVDNAQLLVKTFFKDPKAHKILADIYNDLAVNKKYQDDVSLNRAIAAYRKVQSLAKMDDKNYKSAQFHIDQMLWMRKWYAEHPGK